MGLGIMQERARHDGGKTDASGAHPGRGTEVRVELATAQKE